jgi:hypothetical protein
MTWSAAILNDLLKESAHPSTWLRVSGDTPFGTTRKPLMLSLSKHVLSSVEPPEPA